MKLHIVGEIFGDSGYANHTRQLVNALYNEGIDVALECNLPQNWIRFVNDNELKMINCKKDDADYILLVTLPTVAPLYFSAEKPILQYVVWEGDNIPKPWIDILENHNIYKVIVPSKHTKDAIANTYHKLNNSFKSSDLLDKVHVVPHGVDLDKFFPIVKDKTKELTFISDKGWKDGSRDRGGVSFLLKAFAEEFTSKDNVKLICKINMAYGLTQELLDKQLKELNISNKDRPNIEIIPRNINFSDLNSLYNTADVFVITSLAESFHMGGLQAMACGIPVLYTNFGGQTEYCNDSNGWELKKGTMIDNTWDVLYEGVSWKKPDVIEIRKTLRYIYENKTDVISKSIAALNTAKEFTWQNSAKKLISIL